MQKNLEDLIDMSDPMWPHIQQWMENSPNRIEIASRDKKKASQILVDFQLSTHSSLGAVVWESAGIWVWNGFLRVLGSGDSEMISGLQEWNQPEVFSETGFSPLSVTLVAHDILGGFFAWNHHGPLGKNENIFYFAPDTLQWEDMEFGYTNFIQWAMVGDVQQFYTPFLWGTYETDVSQIDSEHGVSFWPMLWDQQTTIDKKSRRIVPQKELWRLHIYMAKQLASGDSER
jgi:Protein of unknown function DUF2625